jgi:hypothetical protein
MAQYYYTQEELVAAIQQHVQAALQQQNSQAQRDFEAWREVTNRTISTLQAQNRTTEAWCKAMDATIAALLSQINRIERALDESATLMEPWTGFYE